MIIRLVKMTFIPEKVDSFIQLFNDRKKSIRTFPGCLELQLLMHIKNDGIIFTYSEWESEASLEEYRKSDLFLNTWNEVRINFREKPEAWTTIVYSQVN